MACEKVASGGLDRLPVFPGVCPIGRLSTVSSNFLFWKMGCQSRVRRELGDNRKLLDSLKQRMHAHFGKNPILGGTNSDGDVCTQNFGLPVSLFYMTHTSTCYTLTDLNILIYMQYSG